MEIATIEAAKELLYGYPASAFIAERDVLVKQTRATGDRDLAKLIKALRKPSAIAAAVNQVVRQDPDGVELILQAAALLRSAQAGALVGSGVNASELQDQYRAAVAALAQSAPERRAEVRAALEAATIDEPSNQDLRTGCLVVVPTPVPIFGSSTASPAPAPTRDAAPSAEAVDELAQRRAQRRAAKSSEDVAAAEARAAADAKAATKRRIAEEEAAAAEAERVRKAAEKERKRQLKALEKQHRDAMRAHLGALEDQAAASDLVEQAELRLTELAHDILTAEEALASLRAERSDANREHGELVRSADQASLLTERAQTALDELAEQLAALQPPADN